MPSLAERIASSIATGDNLCFPGLATELAADFAAPPERRWVDTDYGTARWLSAHATAPRDVVGVVSLHGGEAVLERLGPTVQTCFPGLEFARDHLSAAESRLAAALELLASVPGVGELVGSLVRAIHLLRAAPGYDVSHSDPGLPFSIFVSVPEPDSSAAAARLAESILHEALHLQLTLIEGHLPLVADQGREGHSPWKGEARPLGGLIHGLYVFAVISQVLARLTPRSAALSGYVNRRRHEIAQEVRALGAAPDGLTAMGLRLWAHAVAVAVAA